MKNNKILLLSTIYPAPDINISNNTNVVHYFAKEWVKQGYEVLVIHNYPVYLKILHWIAMFADKFIASKFNTSVTSVFQEKDVEFELDNVKVVRMPMFKPFPRFSVPQKSLNRQVDKIADYCQRNDFIPDVITAHNYYPHLPIVNRLKKSYFHCAKTCIVVHKQVWKMLRYCGKGYKKEIENIDIWGYRSLPLKSEFENNTGVIPQKYFMCYSGIPEHFLNNLHYCDLSLKINRFVYVGSFIRRKFPEKVLYGILKSKVATDFKLDYVGDGVNRKLIENIISKYKLQDKVTLHGFVKREAVPAHILGAQCFIMISEEETFGLVYLEAMSKGCITIASRNEGMEGIIIDGINGFLCNAGDDDELATIIDKINNMSYEEIKTISKNAIKTALNLSDKKVASMYIENILK